MEPIEVGARFKLPLVWLLTGSRVGDNNQLLALAEALGYPYELKPLHYNQRRRLPLLRHGLNGLKPASRASITPPWPDLILAVGYASVPVARFVREQTGGRAKLVHVGNPRDQLKDFDLQITTPQYTRGPAPNLIALPLPIGNPARHAQPTSVEKGWLQGFPRPRRLIAIGGPARHWQLDHGALRHAIQQIRNKRPRGSLIAATSNRTTPGTRNLLERTLSGDHEAVVDSNPSFATLLAESDEIYVTADSVSMLAEAILSGKPAGMIPIRRSLRGRLSHWLWEWPTGRRTLPDFINFWELLRRRQLIGTVELPVASEVCDTVDRAAAAVRALLTPGGAVEPPGK